MREFSVLFSPSITSGNVNFLPIFGTFPASEPPELSFCLFFGTFVAFVVANSYLFPPCDLRPSSANKLHIILAVFLRPTVIKILPSLG